MLERFDLLQHAPLEGARTLLEIGSGPHAVATVPLAFRVGPEGRLLAGELSRWGNFVSIVADSGLGNRIFPVACDARRLPLRDDAVDLALCVHGLRSLRGEPNSVRIIREMLRAAPRIFLAESLPVARTAAQRSHLGLYDLREQVFRAGSGVADDSRYPTLERVTSLVEQAGGIVDAREIVEIDLPHFLAYFPRSLVERVPAAETRDRLLQRWDEAEAIWRQKGEDHPPVGIVVAHRP